MNFEELLKERHSAINFIKDFTMSESDFKKIFELTKLAPTAYNLQPANYLVVTDEVKKELVRELSYNQYKIHTASGVVFVMADKNSFTVESAEKIYKPLKMLGIMNEDDYNTNLNYIKGYISGLENDTAKLNKDLLTNTIISATFFMLSAKHYGFDTCPMYVHNIPELRKEFNIPDNLEPLLMITIGKSVDKVRPRGYRKPVGEFVSFNGY